MAPRGNTCTVRKSPRKLVLEEWTSTFCTFKSWDQEPGWSQKYLLVWSKPKHCRYRNQFKFLGNFYERTALEGLVIHRRCKMFSNPTLERFHTLPGTAFAPHKLILMEEQKEAMGEPCPLKTQGTTTSTYDSISLPHEQGWSQAVTQARALLCQL